MNQEAIQALRKLIEDFEYQLQCQSEVDEEVTSEEEEEEALKKKKKNLLRSWLLTQLFKFKIEEYVEVSLQREPSCTCVMTGFSQWLP